MEPLDDTAAVTALGFPTATPVLDVLRPQPPQESERLSTGDHFFISSAVIVAFIKLQYIRAFVDSMAHQSLLAFWAGIVGLPLLAFVAAAAVHQLGHMFGGLITGFETVAIKIGQFRLRDKTETTDVLALGFLVMRSCSPERLRRRLIVLFLSGPLLSIVLPVVLEAGLRLVQNRWGALNFVVSAGVDVFSALSFLIGISTLLPDKDSSGNFSDGTRLVMLLENDVRAARLLAMLELQQRSNSGDHPRNWGEDLVARAVAPKDESFDTVAANWLAYLWASAGQDLNPATKYLERALNALGSSPGHLRDRIFLEAAIFQAWYRHNLVKAQLWKSQIVNPNLLPIWERRRLDIASCWAEGKSFDAWEQLQAHLQQVRQLPLSPLRTSAERDALEWKGQMESRMLTGAWATMHSWPYQRQTQLV